jgi:hypothetical protein
VCFFFVHSSSVWFSAVCTAEKFTTATTTKLAMTFKGHKNPPETNKPEKNLDDINEVTR